MSAKTKARLKKYNQEHNIPETTPHIYDPSGLLAVDEYGRVYLKDEKTPDEIEEERLNEYEEPIIPGEEPKNNNNEPRLYEEEDFLNHGQNLDTGINLAGGIKIDDDENTPINGVAPDPIAEIIARDNKIKKDLAAAIGNAADKAENKTKSNIKQLTTLAIAAIILIVLAKKNN